MDILLINKTELTNPYKDIIIDENNFVVLIDFERCKKTEKPKNITQFLQYLIKKSSELEKKKILVDKNKLFLLGKDYKLNPSDKNFRRITALFL
jgi:predicted Ser/Thr protein kinase